MALKIEKVAILGAGVMGGQIAAHLANAGIPSLAFDMNQELAEKGVAREIADAVLEDIDESKGAMRAARKRARRWSQLPYQEFRQKLGGFLQRRGFSYDTIRHTIDTLWNQLENQQ